MQHRLHVCERPRIFGRAERAFVTQTRSVSMAVGSAETCLARYREVKTSGVGTTAATIDLLE
jgi:hypothetical protein